METRLKVTGVMLYFEIPYVIYGFLHININTWNHLECQKQSYFILKWKKTKENAN